MTPLKIPGFKIAFKYLHQPRYRSIWYYQPSSLAGNELAAFALLEPYGSSFQALLSLEGLIEDIG